MAEPTGQNCGTIQASLPLILRLWTTVPISWWQLPTTEYSIAVMVETTGMKPAVWIKAVVSF